MGETGEETEQRGRRRYPGLKAKGCQVPRTWGERGQNAKQDKQDAAVFLPQIRVAFTWLMVQMMRKSILRIRSAKGSQASTLFTSKWTKKKKKKKNPCVLIGFPTSFLFPQNSKLPLVVARSTLVTSFSP